MHSLRILGQLTRCRMREFVREPSALIFVVCMPVVWIVGLGWFYRRDIPPPLRVALLEPLAEEPQEMAALLAADARVRLIPGGSETALRHRRVDLLVEAREGGVKYVFDPHVAEGRVAQLVVDDILQRGMGRVDPLATSLAASPQSGSRYVDFLLPGVLAFSIFTSSLFGTGMTIVANRREKLLKRYLVTPMSPFLYIGSHVIGRLLILMVEMATVLITGTLVFGFRIGGSLSLLVTVAVLAAACFTSLALALAARGRHTGAYNGLVNLITFPLMLSSGVWFARDVFPHWLIRLTDVSPLTAGVEALRRIALDAATLSDLRLELALLIGYGLLFTAVARWRFRWG